MKKSNMKIHSCGSVKRIAIVFTFSLISLTHYGQLWLDLDSGFRCGPHFSYVYQLLADEDNKTITAGGWLTTLDCEELYVPAIWDGSDWTKIGEQGGAGIFNPIGKYGNSLYAGGRYFGNDKTPFLQFTNHGWDSVATDLKLFDFSSFTELNGELYGTVLSYFTIAGDSANLAFKWNGNHVQPLVDFFAENASGHCLGLYHDTLFVGGHFWDSQRNINHFASIYDGDIHQVGQGFGIDGNVMSMIVYDDKLWLGGSFLGAYFGKPGYVNLVCYDGDSLHLAPNQTNGRVVSMEVHENELYLAGWFSEIDGKESHGVAKLNQFGSFAINPDTIYNSYDTPASTFPNVVRDIAIMNDTLYIAGDFKRIGSCDNLNSIAKLNKSLTGKSIPLQSNFIIYPNPTLGELVLETNSYFNQSAPIRMYDSSGRLVLEDTWLLGERQKRISLSSFSNGAYILHLETNGEKLSRTIIKE
jgi:hypothetical protein